MRRIAWLLFIVAWAVLYGAMFAHARDDGRFANSQLKAWFDQLKSGKGMCCSFADGVSIEDVDWDTATVADAGGKETVVYRVRLNGQWINVPPDAVITEPNKAKHAVVWPYQDMNGVTQIRCFIRGPET